MTRVALVQIASPDEESRDERIGRVETLLRARDGEGIELFVLPELWSAGYLAFDRYDELAEPGDGPTVSMCIRVARDLGVWVHAGSFVERGEDGRLHNTTVLVDPLGRIAQVYRKIHVFGYRSREAELLTPGDSLSVVDTPLGRLASTTCYDLRFPGLWSEIGARGAETAIVPAAWPAARREHFTLFTEARAVEHQLWIIAVNACGVQAGVELAGCSRVVDPWGRVIAECSPDVEEIAVVDVDPSLVAEVRSEFPVLRDRLPSGGYAELR
ncbi:carbon-nitrogen family hydrolase [Leucobacter weissii]|uniref:Carbon-nitrogen family hydrolase n=1 Tax=Leucobacter weissii TaxID=1983706 RepID=A0A939MLU7_9MICO|nr:nitrilase-related carbon-nitrogen hydrolase [Leucobacter weissii]MBO1902265.1 carbon-nitrogen family hydrolase [Leucobacter weissii]